MSGKETLAYNRGFADGRADTEITNRRVMAIAAESVLMDLLSVHNGEHQCTGSLDGVICASEWIYNKIGDAVHERLVEISANIEAATASGGPTE